MTATMAPQVSFDEEYFESLARLQPIESKRVNDALLQFRKDPDHRGLNFESLKGALRKLYSIRAGQDLRIILFRRGNSYVFWFADHHDAAYERARRAQFVINPTTEFMGFVEPGEAPSTGATAERSTATTQTPDRPRPFDHWRDEELEAAGFEASEVGQLRALISETDLCDLEARGWTEERIELAIDLLEYTPEQWVARGSIEQEGKASEERLRHAVDRFGAVAGLSPFFSEDELERIAAAPIEEWMMFLHPDQRAIVDKEYAGPARVRGAAGTGKTVVVLHRAAALSKRFESGPTGRILVTTYIRSLPLVFEQLFARLPDADPARVDFVNADRLAYRICAEAGVKPRLDTKGVDAAFASAWRKVVTAGSPIDRAGLTRGYLSDEIRYVIKGRGIAEIDDYLDLKRTGRRTQMAEQLRRNVWELKQAWDEAMAQRNVEDFHDVVIRARDVARSRQTPMYRAALIDEAQDLTLVALQLIRALVNGPGPDRPDALFIAGDGAQRIYAGGFTLRQAGVEVRGRTSVLRVNYRNTDEVYRVAIGVAGGDQIEDLDEEYRRSDEPTALGRSGAPAELLVGTSFDDELDRIAARIRALTTDDDGVGAGDIAVCCATNKLAKAAVACLSLHGISTQELDKYDGVANGLVKVGTHHRVKGLEFKVVFLPGLTDGEFPRPPANGMDPKEYEDQHALNMSALFVAMTRARDRLVLSCTDHPSEVLGPVIGRLQ
ncbi:MAG TPA: 3'-5' exonuclease [Microthrixaceae bacterium]|nr:3'-5' exonuclease [Microthrixaceae bacterium]HMT23706.1 3'-5' exonuclease [Microthrixaceae bacterium]HMT62664.1 3'-5' exonuclease [Microthrixaceae bacterium]